MGFTVENLLGAEEGKKMTLICGEDGLQNEIKGVTIIEAPDIVKFINGGELLLTGLYAFKSCSIDEFKNYISEFRKKNISGLLFKKGRRVEQADVKIELLTDYAQKHHIPLIEVPFEYSFQKIMSFVMENLFNEEVTRLKYYKVTHDNFTALSFSNNRKKNPVQDILDMLEKLVRNPVSLYNQNMTCYAATTCETEHFKILENVQQYDPGIITNYQYLMQEGEHNQYIVKLQLNSGGLKMYLVVTEKNSNFTAIDCIAIENAIVALQYEFSREFAVEELEKKFQNDVLNNILNGKITSDTELEKNARLLDIDKDGYYRVIVFGVVNEGKSKPNINEKLLHINYLEEAVRQQLPKLRIHRDIDKIVAIQDVDPELTQSEYRKELKKMRDKVQNEVNFRNKYLKVKAGVGKIAEGLRRLPESYKEADDAFSFIDIAGDIVDDRESCIMMFSDFGIFKLLCQLNDPELLLEYIPESLQKLYNYKKPQQEDLVETLKVYLKYNQNLSKTAQDLYVHYKTAAYRIEKISKITGMDFDNANEMLAVRIGLIVQKRIENYNKK